MRKTSQVKSIPTSTAEDARTEDLLKRLETCLIKVEERINEGQPLTGRAAKPYSPDGWAQTCQMRVHLGGISNKTFQKMAKMPGAPRGWEYSETLTLHNVKKWDQFIEDQIQRREGNE